MTRDEAMELLPFLANGTLEDDERQAVEAHLGADAEMQAELAALQNIRATMQAEDMGFSPGEMGLARLMKEVGEAPQKRAAQPTRIWQIAAALLMAVVLGQALLLTRGGTNDPGYVLAGETPAAFTVTIQPDATEADLRTLLLDAGVEIVAGPSALGLYQLGLVEGSDARAAREALEDAPAIIETLTAAEETE